MLAKLGMRQEGVLREFAPKGGGFEDAVLVSLLRREWGGKGEKLKGGRRTTDYGPRDCWTAQMVQG